MNIELTESSQKFDNFPTTKTERVLEKWSDNDGEIKKETIRKAANQYAKLEVNNRILKWIIVAVVTFLFVLLGFMIASVVIGVNITKEVTVKNGQLVSASGNNSVVKTSTVKYYNKITLNSPSSVIDSLSSITVTVSDGIYEGVLQFEVVSYMFIPGKKLTFYGHTHQADVNPDGTVKLTNLVGNKRTEGSTSGQSIDGTSNNGGSSNVVKITSCSDLANIQATGNFEFTTDLDCSELQLPLLNGQVFTGILDGRGKKLKLTFSSSTSKVALFDTIGAGGSVNGVLLEGSLTGVDQCAGFAIKALTGSYFSKNSNFATITCSSGSNNAAGGFFAVVDTSSSNDNIVIDKSVAQPKITFNSNSAVVGGFYGKSTTTSSIVTFSKSSVDVVSTTTGVSHNFGTLASGLEDCPGGDNYIVVDVGQTSAPLECGLPIERCPNNPHKFNCDSLFCYSCRDKSSRNNAKRSLELRKTPDNVQITPNFPQDVCY